MIPELALLHIVFVTLDKVLQLSNLYLLICEKGLIVASTHGVVRMKKENVNEVCGIVSGTIKCSVNIGSLKHLHPHQCCMSLLRWGCCGQQMLLPHCADSVAQSLGLWTVQILSLLILKEAFLRHNLLLLNVIANFPFEYTVLRRCLYLWKWLLQSP